MTEATRVPTAKTTATPVRFSATPKTPIPATPAIIIATMVIRSSRKPRA
jgi:hypothetical protein